MAPDEKLECGYSCDCRGDMSRREFLVDGGTAVGMGMVGLSGAKSASGVNRDSAGGRDTPAFKRWLASLTERGAARIYRGPELQHIGFPIGGIGAGTVGITGRGELSHWEVFNNFRFAATLPFGFLAIRARKGRAPAVTKMLQVDGAYDKAGVKDIRLSAEYPFLRLEYEDDGLPVDVKLTAYSPFIPLNAKDSGLPAAILRFTVKNPSDEPVDVSLLTSIPNAVGWDGYQNVTGNDYAGYGGNFGRFEKKDDLARLVLQTQQGRRDKFARRLHWVTNRSTLRSTVQQAENLTSTFRDLGRTDRIVNAKDPKIDVAWLDSVGPQTRNASSVLKDILKLLDAGTPVILSGIEEHLLHLLRAPEGGGEKDIVFEDFETGTLDNWTAEGDAFKRPATGTNPNQQRVRGKRGKYLINSFDPNDVPTGTLTSRPFTIERAYIHLLVGGGRHSGKTCVNLKIGDNVVQTATGRNREMLDPVAWDVRKFLGREAVIEVVDQHSGGWGHVLVDQIVFSSSPILGVDSRMVRRLRERLGFTWEAIEEVEGTGRIVESVGLTAGLEHGERRRELRLQGLKLADEAEVLAANADGDPLIVRRKIGPGQLIVCLGQPHRWYPGREARTLVGKILGTATGIAYEPMTGWWPEAARNGNLALTLLGAQPSALCGYTDVDELWADFAEDGRLDGPAQSIPSPPGQTTNGALAGSLRLAPGESRDVTFLLTWYFPNRYRTPDYGWHKPEMDFQHRLGNQYNNWFSSAGEVAEYVCKNLPRLERDSELFRKTFHDSTLPRYFIEAVSANFAILRSQVTIWLEDGTFAGFEGADRCCPLNCTHVYNYAMTTAFLFPDLERNVRETDLLTQQREDGSIPHRTVVPLSLPRLWGSIGGPHDHALDGMLGTVLKTYREHRQFGDRRWLEKVWPRVEKLMAYVMKTFDPAGDGVMRGSQPNTYDIHTYGSNTFLGTLYLGALRSAARMADQLGHRGVAKTYRDRAEIGGQNYDKTCWKNDFYVNMYDAPGVRPATYERHNCWGPGCHSDQLLGQWWADVLELGDLLPRDHIHQATKSMFRYNWRDDLSSFEHRQRIFAKKREKGLLNCSWPNGGRPKNPIRYCDEVWTGIEYAVAGLLLHEGLTTEALQIIRGARDRYTGDQRNPFAEVECGIFYARALAGYALLPLAGGIGYDAARGRLAFAPKMQPDDCRLFFIGNQGWGTLHQKRSPKSQSNSLSVAYGKLAFQEIALQAAGPANVNVAVDLNGRPLEANVTRRADRVVVTFATPLPITAGQTLTVRMQAS